MQLLTDRAIMLSLNGPLLARRLAAVTFVLLSLFSVSSCKQDDGSGLLAIFTQMQVPSDYADKAWKADIGDCTYSISFDEKSVRTDLAKCGDKVAFNSFKTVAKQTDSGLLLTSVALARNSCKKYAKHALEMNPFFAEITEDGALEIWTRKKVNSVRFVPADANEIAGWIQSAPTDGTACVN